VNLFAQTAKVYGLGVIVIASALIAFTAISHERVASVRSLESDGFSCRPLVGGLLSIRPY